MNANRKKIIVAITGASGVGYGIALVEALGVLGHETLLVVSKAGKLVMRQETGMAPEDLLRPGISLYQEENIAAPIASGSFAADGMVIAPCTMATLASVALGQASDLILRAADVTLKEGRPLILVPRETPLNRIHITNMLHAHDAGAVIMPAMPPLYGNPTSVAELIAHLVGRILDRLGIENNLAPRWDKLSADPESGEEK